MIELDVLRGFAVAVMILVTSPGSWVYTYAEMQHAEWHGWTFADFVFPDFLFGVGMALGLTYGRSLDPVADRLTFWRKVGRRVIGLIALGLVVNGAYYLAGHLGSPPVGPDDETHFRIPGVLQRIALAYLIAMLAMFALGKRSGSHAQPPGPLAIAALIGIFLLGYWALLMFVPAPGGTAGDLSIAGNLPGYVDRQVFGQEHMWALGAETWRGPVFYDPEGLLATLPASTNILFGVIVVGLWRSKRPTRVAEIAGLGACLIAAAYLIDPMFPINKKIWTSPFALLTSGLSCFVLLIVAGLLRLRLLPLLAPLRVLGGNAILAFSLSIAFTAFASVPLPFGASDASMRERGFAVTSAIIADPYLASLAYAFCALGVILLLILPLERRGIHLRL